MRKPIRATLLKSLTFTYEMFKRSSNAVFNWYDPRYLELITWETCQAKMRHSPGRAFDIELVFALRSGHFGLDAGLTPQ